MSIQYCEKHNKYYDEDYDTTPQCCIDETNKLEEEINEFTGKPRQSTTPSELINNLNII